MKTILFEVLSIAILLVLGILLGKLIPFPAPLISMILFLIFLFTGILKEEIFRTGLSDIILKYLSFFFLTPAVRVLGSLDILEGVVIRLLLVMLISNILVMGVTGMVTQRLLKREHDA